jgi:UrcA family protein
MTILLFLASLSAGPAALPAPAGEQTARTSIVRFADLDLTTSAGRATLDRRVKRAVKHVCAFAWPSRPTDFDQVSACREQALKDATRQIQLAAGSSADNSELWASK